MTTLIQALLLAGIFSTAIVSAYAQTVNEIGNSVVMDLYARYNWITEHCGTDKLQPAFYCSGIIIRTTGTGDYDHWDPSPHSITSGGVSFSYIRADVLGGVYGVSDVHGFLLDAPEKMAAGKLKPTVLCYFPRDASSSHRSGEGGCGEENGDLYSRPCDTLGIHSAAEWYQNMVDHKTMCGFNLKDPKIATEVFHQGILTSKYIEASVIKNSKGFTGWNELILKAWTPGAPGKLPIQAFFYAPWKGDERLAYAGRKTAMLDQKKYFEKTGVFVPVIEITVPRSVNEGSFKFSYHLDDQTIQP